MHSIVCGNWVCNQAKKRLDNFPFIFFFTWDVCAVIVALITLKFSTFSTLVVILSSPPIISGWPGRHGTRQGEEVQLLQWVLAYTDTRKRERMLQKYYSSVIFEIIEDAWIHVFISYLLWHSSRQAVLSGNHWPGLKHWPEVKFSLSALNLFLKHCFFSVTPVIFLSELLQCMAFRIVSHERLRRI